MAYQQDLEFDCGVDVVLPVTLYDAETGTTPLSLTGVQEIRYRVARQLHPDWPVLLEKLLSDADITVDGDPADGAITITLEAQDTLTTVLGAETARLTGIYEHELRVTDSGGLVTALFSGRATIHPTGPV